MEFDPVEFIPFWPSGNGKYKPHSWDDRISLDQIIKDDDLLYAVPTGKEAGFLVVDLDEWTDESRQWLIDNEVASSLTYTVNTKSGGRHWFFLYPEFDVPRKIRAFPGIDIIADNSVIFCPPSKGYEVVADWPIAPLPDKLVMALRSASTKPPEPQVSSEPSDIYVDTGSRNNTLYLQGVAIRKR